MDNSRPRRAPLVAGAAWIALLSAAPLSAHGGMYRGPAPVPITPYPGGPLTGGGGLPAMPGGPSTNSLPIPAGGEGAWQFWWEFNKDPFLQLKDAVHDPGAIRGSDEFFMGSQNSSRRLDTLEPSEQEKREVILPAVKRLLDSTTNKDIATACMVAMAKMGLDHPEFRIADVFRKHLARGNQEVRETAALCLGISQRTDALDDLLPLALDEPRGRRLVGRTVVDDRTRSFAVYGLGLIAHAQPDLSTKQTVYDAMARLLEDGRIENRDLRVALVQGIGILAPDPRVAGQKRLMWRALETLWRFYQLDIGKGDQIVQAHVPTSIARLLGRGDSSDHLRYKNAFAAELAKRRSRHNSIYQSAALALGKMALPAELNSEDARFSEVLLDYAKSGRNQLGQFFSLVALGEIGGDANRAELLKFYLRAHKGTDKPWAGLALGVLGYHSQVQRGEPDTGIGEVLLQGFKRVENEDHRAAVAVALGLCGFEKAIPEMRRHLANSQRRDMLGGYICVGLALMGAEEARADIRELVASSVRRPLLLTQAAVSLGKLGDKQAGDYLLQILKSGDSNLAKLSGIATAYRFIGDRRAMKPLVDVMFDENMTTVSRAFVAAALGGIGDKERLPWNTKLAVGTNYRAVTDTLTNGMTGILDIL